MLSEPLTAWLSSGCIQFSGSTLFDIAFSVGILNPKSRYLCFTFSCRFSLVSSLSQRSFFVAIELQNDPWFWCCFSWLSMNISVSLAPLHRLFFCFPPSRHLNRQHGTGSTRLGIGLFIYVHGSSCCHELLQHVFSEIFIPKFIGKHSPFNEIPIHICHQFLVFLEVDGGECWRVQGVLGGYKNTLGTYVLFEYLILKYRL